MGATMVRTRAARDRYTEKQISETGWSLFFIWIGFAMLRDLSWGEALLGIGVITLGAQAARRFFRLRVEAFWALVGLIFVAGGLWDSFGIRAELLPVLCIAAGVLLLLSTLLHQHRGRAT